MPEKLSFYMLTKNAEQHLEIILQRINEVADEMIILDSGSEDQTAAIAARWPVSWHVRAFDNFRDQRAHALALCRHDYVLFLDADEIPDHTLIQHLQMLKQNGFGADAYSLCREWAVLGKPIHSIYPICSPDFPVRLVDRRRVSFDRSAQVHEDYQGYRHCLKLSGKIVHYSFQSRAEITRKLNLYSAIAAADLLEKGKKFNFYKLFFNPLVAWIKWYGFKQGWKDGWVGLILANYAARYTFLKYRKHRASMKNCNNSAQKTAQKIIQKNARSP